MFVLKSRFNQLKSDVRILKQDVDDQKRYKDAAYKETQEYKEKLLIAQAEHQDLKNFLKEVEEENRQLKNKIDRQALHLEQHLSSIDRLRSDLLETDYALKDRLESNSVTIEHQANDDGRLAGSLHSEDLLGAINAQMGIQLTADQILFDYVADLGLYTIPIDLGHGIIAKLKVWVLPTVEDMDQENSSR